MHIQTNVRRDIKTVDFIITWGQHWLLKFQTIILLSNHANNLPANNKKYRYVHVFPRWCLYIHVCMSV